MYAITNMYYGIYLMYVTTTTPQNVNFFQLCIQHIPGFISNVTDWSRFQSIVVQHSLAMSSIRIQKLCFRLGRRNLAGPKGYYTVQG